jgi:hypothetical protein
VLRWVASTIQFLRAPAVDGEIACLALLAVGVVLGAGFEWHKELRGTLIVAGAAGLGIRVLLDPSWWRFSWRALLALLVAIAAAVVLGVSGGIFAAVATHEWKVAPTVAPAAGARPEILVSPCPSPGEQLSRRSDGSYVCLVPIPPDPGTGPVVAPPQ